MNTISINVSMDPDELRNAAGVLTGIANVVESNVEADKEPEFLEMIHIIQYADMAFTNLEMLFHDYEPYPIATSGGTWLRPATALA